MGAIKDLVDLVKELESRSKERKDIEFVHRLNQLVSDIRDQHVEIVERDVQLIRDNEDLRRQLAEANAEEIRIEEAIEFRRGKRTGGQWKPFCPKCHMPAVHNHAHSTYFAGCSAHCGWRSALQKHFNDAIPEVLKKLES